jgi:hypothetical protein
MKKEILFVFGLVSALSVYCQSSTDNLPQLQISGYIETNRADSSASTEIKVIATDAVAVPPVGTSGKTANEGSTPSLTTAEPKKKYF